ncbi:MAG TPA: alanine--tRNA ligase-related protein, partial [Candidatus Pacearchaeota archaeon]|nr:alanine--tRNA ligase-related protein [Candidatus Pacearchaeota archaeon]
PELGCEEAIISGISNEEEKFYKALEKGLKELQKIQERRISGKQAFDLYQSYGLPIELIMEEAQARQQTVDFSAFETELAKHQELSRTGAQKLFGGHGAGDIQNEADKAKVVKLHTATHLLQAALRKILGEKVGQQGSNITPERLRFDFSFERKMTPEEIKQVEDLVNDIIRQDLPVLKQEMSFREATNSGALAFFKEKYPDKVLVYSIGDFSKELCGGPHVSRTGEIGNFKILKEEASSAGIRRIKADINA